MSETQDTAKVNGPIESAHDISHADITNAERPVYPETLRMLREFCLTDIETSTKQFVDRLDHVRRTEMMSDKDRSDMAELAHRISKLWTIIGDQLLPYDELPF